LSVEGIRTPQIYCPFPSQISPYAQAIQEHTLAWATRFRLISGAAAVDRFLSSRFSSATARNFPRADLEDLELLNDWTVWIFLWDDQFDDASTAISPDELETILDSYQTILVARGARPGSGPAAEALRDLCDRTFPRMPSQWRDRFVTHFVQWLDSYTWAVGNRQRGKVPTPDVYMENRRSNGAVYVEIDLIDLSEHVTLPETLRTSRPFETMHRITNDVVCWTNDIYSLEKELARGDLNNLVIVLKEAESMTLQEAVDRVSEMIAAQVRLFEETESCLPTFGPELDNDIRRHIGGLRSWMRGNLDWSARTARYSNVERTGAGRPASYLEDLLATGVEARGRGDG
jgi:hypothetical protein